MKLGSVNETSVQTTKTAIFERFKLKAEEAGTLPLSESCFNKKRNQYLSSCLMEDMKNHISAGNNIVIGITEKDIFARNLNFVFGQAELGGRYAIVSTARLKETFYGASQENEKLLKKRISTEVVHELGHVLGLEHCLSRHCVMFFSNSIVDTDMKSDQFCDVCKNQLSEIGFHL